METSCVISIFTITFCIDVQLNWFLWSRKEDSNIYKFLLYHKFGKKIFLEVKRGLEVDQKKKKKKDSHPKFEGFSLFLLEEVEVIEEEKP